MRAPAAGASASTGAARPGPRARPAEVAVDLEADEELTVDEREEAAEAEAEADAGMEAVTAHADALLRAVGPLLRRAPAYAVVSATALLGLAASAAARRGRRPGSRLLVQAQALAAARAAAAASGRRAEDPAAVAAAASATAAADTKLLVLLDMSSGPASDQHAWPQQRMQLADSARWFVLHWWPGEDAATGGSAGSGGVGLGPGKLEPLRDFAARFASGPPDLDPEMQAEVERGVLELVSVMPSPSTDGRAGLAQLFDALSGGRLREAELLPLGQWFAAVAPASAAGVPQAQAQAQGAAWPSGGGSGAGGRRAPAPPQRTPASGRWTAASFGPGGAALLLLAEAAMGARAAQEQEEEGGAEGDEEDDDVYGPGYRPGRSARGGGDDGRRQSLPKPQQRRQSDLSPPQDSAGAGGRAADRPTAAAGVGAGAASPPGAAAVTVDCDHKPQPVFQNTRNPSGWELKHLTAQSEQRPAAEAANAAASGGSAAAAAAAAPGSIAAASAAAAVAESEPPYESRSVDCPLGAAARLSDMFPRARPEQLAELAERIRKEERGQERPPVYVRLGRLAPLRPGHCPVASSGPGDPGTMVGLMVCPAGASDASDQAARPCRGPMLLLIADERQAGAPGAQQPRCADEAAAGGGVAATAGGAGKGLAGAGCSAEATGGMTSGDEGALARLEHRGGETQEGTAAGGIGGSGTGGGAGGSWVRCEDPRDAAERYLLPAALQSQSWMEVFEVAMVEASRERTWVPYRSWRQDADAVMTPGRHPLETMLGGLAA
ncbi:hypothetical protein GPECTOR_63g19 [Gonium pectorale]|uniref:Uncharacterized protein n=1 Tax=Gonium pectorale TaxID=33097 RepID=A0A150G5T8_GONPE|nr:hypothetical protein GPECTOR_63g19 [Gonium pectorale]|eukprot:KXZ44690.1 hypothetical protein GPECTOR_63g19 [Gonium pectorale]